MLLPVAFKALAELVAAEAQRLGATAVGGTTMGADPIACAALAGGADVKAFFVRKDRKEHGLQRWVEGPFLEDGDRCLVVEDVVTTGGSTMHALERLREEGRQVVGVVSVLDRLAGGAEAIEQAAGAPYVALTTIDDVYPDRPEREISGEYGCRGLWAIAHAKAHSRRFLPNEGHQGERRNAAAARGRLPPDRCAPGAAATADGTRSADRDARAHAVHELARAGARPRGPLWPAGLGRPD